MKIGVGITTTTKRHDYMSLFDMVLNKAGNYHISIIKNASTITEGKNKNLMALRDCDYIFLFDDDCFPIQEGWAEYFIQSSSQSGNHHFMYLRETPTLKLTQTINEIDIYNNCAGCMMFITKEALQKVGGYNPEYKRYGYEHAGYSARINKAGLTPYGKYLCPSKAGEYIYSMDLDNHLQLPIKHTPTLNSNEMFSTIEYNRQVYLKELVRDNYFIDLC